MQDSVIVIEPGRAEQNYLRDLWYYRDLFVILSWRDVSVRYKQTVIGIAWAVIRPFLTMIVFTLVFGGIAGLPSDGNAPYALMVFAGMLPWTLFSTGLSDASSSLINNASLVGKVYFPRAIMPAAAVISAIADFVVSLTILFGLMVFYHYPPTWHLVFLPVFTLLTVIACLGPGMWLAALSVKYRDFRYVVPFVIQLGLYVSPVGFSSDVVPEQYRLLYYLNPMAGVIEGFRWCILGDNAAFSAAGLIIALVVMIFLLWFGFDRFRKMEKSLADFI